MEFDEQLIHEISLCKTRDDITFPLKTIKNGKQTKIETLLYNLNKVINPSNIGKVDYTEGGDIFGNEFRPLDEVFSDNVIVYTPIDDNIITDLDEIREKVRGIDTITDENDKEDTSIPKSVREAARSILSETTSRIKRVFVELGININKKNIVPTNPKRSYSLKHKPSEFVQLLKIDLSSTDPAAVLRIINDPTLLEFLHNNNIYVHDIDFTQDYSGVFYKPDVVEHLLNIGYRFQKDFNYDEEFDEPTHIGTVLDNDDKVSRNCLTFIRTVQGIAIRYKFYNKFVQSMESPSVRKKIGSNVKNWINNPERYLNRAINKSIDTGLLRLEITFYANGDTTLLTHEFIKEQMDFLQTQMDPMLVFRNPISNQFNLLCDKILYNVCLYDTTTKTAFVVLYHNKVTNKANGFYVKDATSIKLSNALRYYCSNKPVVVALLSIDIDNGLVSVQQDSYVRVSASREELYTFVNKGSENLVGYKVDKNAKQPFEAGLLPNSTFNYKISPTAISLTKTSKYPIVFKKREDIDLLRYPTEEHNLRTINKIIRQEAAMDSFNIEEKETIEQVKKENALLEEEAAKERIRQKMYEILKNTKSYTKRFIDLPDNSFLNVYGFKPITSRWGDTYLLVCSWDDKIYDNSNLYLFWATTNITNFIKKGLSHYKKLDIHSIIAYGTLTGDPIMLIEKTGTYTSVTNNKCASVRVVGFKSNDKEDITRSQNVLEELPNTIKVSTSKKLDKEVAEGDRVVVLGIRLLKKTVIIKASINEGAPDNYVISHWLKEIVNKELENNIAFTVVAGPNKTTPNKKVERMYIK